MKEVKLFPGLFFFPLFSFFHPTDVAFGKDHSFPPPPLEGADEGDGRTVFLPSFFFLSLLPQVIDAVFILILFFFFLSLPPIDDEPVLEMSATSLHSSPPFFFFPLLVLMGHSGTAPAGTILFFFFFFRPQGSFAVVRARAVKLHAEGDPPFFFSPFSCRPHARGIK